MSTATYTQAQEGHVLRFSFLFFAVSLHGIWDLSSLSRIHPMPPALQRRVLITRSPGKLQTLGLVLAMAALGG